MASGPPARRAAGVSPIRRSARWRVGRAWAGVRAGDQAAAWARAVSVAEGVEPGVRVDVVTDQPPPAGDQRVHYHDVAGGGINVGISAFDLGIQQAYVGVVSNSPRPLEGGVRLTRDGAPIASGSVLVPALGRAAARDGR